MLPRRLTAFLSRLQEAWSARRDAQVPQASGRSAAVPATGQPDDPRTGERRRLKGVSGSITARRQAHACLPASGKRLFISRTMVASLKRPTRSGRHAQTRSVRAV